MMKILQGNLANQHNARSSDVPIRMEAIGPRIREKSANDEARAVHNIVSSVNSSQKVETIYKSAQYIKYLEPSNKYKMIHGMINTFSEMHDESQPPNGSLSKVAEAIQSAKSYMTEDHKVAFAAIVFSNPDTARFFVKKLRPPAQTSTRPDTAVSAQNSLQTPKSKLADVRFLSDKQEKQLAGSIANNPHPRDQARQLAGYSNQLGSFESENRSAIINSALNTVKNDKVNDEIRAAVAAILLKSQHVMSNEQKAEISNIVLGHVSGGHAIIEGAKRANAELDQAKARSDLINRDRDRTIFSR